MLEKIKRNKQIWIFIIIGICLIVSTMVCVLVNRGAHKPIKKENENTQIEAHQNEESADESTNEDEIQIVDKDADEEEESVQAPVSWGGTSEGNKDNGLHPGINDSNTSDEDNKSNNNEEVQGESKNQEDETVLKDNVLEDEKEWSEPL